MANVNRPYPNLPGFNYVLKDGNLVAVQDAPATKSLLLFGRAFWGPTNQPVQVKSIQDAEALFGTVVDHTGEFTGTSSNRKYIGNDLILQAHLAFVTGCRDVRLCRLPFDNSAGVDLGEVACSVSITIETTATSDDTLTIAARYPGYVGRAFKVSTYLNTDAAEATPETTISRLRIKVANCLGGAVFVFYLADYGTLGELVDAINSKAGDYVIASLSATTQAGMGPSGVGPLSVAWSLILPLLGLSGNTTSNTSIKDMSSAVAFGTSGSGYTGVAGSNCTTAPTLTNVFTVLGDPTTYDSTAPKALQLLREYNVDYVAYETYGVDEITGATDNILQSFTDFCHIQYLSGFSTQAVLGVKPLVGNPTLTVIQDQKDDLMDTTVYPAIIMETGIPTTSTTDNPSVDGGRYVSIVGGPSVAAHQKEIGIQQYSGAVLYAGMLTTLTPQDPPTNNPIPGAINTIFNFNLSQTNDLVGGVGGSEEEKGGAYVILKQEEGSIVPVTGPTCSKRGSDYQWIQIMNICATAMSNVRRACKGFIGKEFGLPQRNAMRTAVSRVLDEMVDLGMLFGGEGVGYNFSISQDANDRILGKATINLALRPVLELRWIQVVVSVLP